MRPFLFLPPILALLAAGPALALDCQAEAEQELQRLGVTAGEISDIDYVEMPNPTKHGPEVLGVRAWIRLKSCSNGYLVVDITRSCFVRQSYTRHDCRWQGVTAY
ncbi:MAG: hypothetical protein ACFCUT_03025 [Kiloniellaceae bacterium]